MREKKIEPAWRLKITFTNDKHDWIWDFMWKSNLFRSNLIDFREMSVMSKKTILFVLISVRQAWSSIWKCWQLASWLVS